MTITKRSARAITAPPNAGEILRDARIRMFSRYLDREYVNGPMGMIETVKEAKSRGLSLVPYADFEPASDMPVGNGQAKIRTGTLVIHEADGRTLGGKVVSGGSFSSPERLFYDVPRHLRGKSGWLVAESPNFDFIDRGEAYEAVVPEGRIIHVERAATHGGRFMKDRETGVPIGDRIMDNDRQRQGTVSVNNKHEPCIDLIAKDVGSGTIFLDVGTSEKLRALARAVITPENYVQHVVSRLKREDCSLEIKRFIYDWIASDPILQEAVNRSRLLSIFADKSL
jgi:hypothetical protein